MGKRPNTKAKKEKFSWHIYVDRSLKDRTKTVATLNKQEVREFISDVIRERLKEEVIII